MVSREELLAKAKRPADDAMRLHPFYRGKMQVMPKCAIRGLVDFAIWYSPGVAAPCTAIQRQPELVYDYTKIWLPHWISSARVSLGSSICTMD